MEINRLRHIKMRHLSAFVETVRCGSLKAASENINLTQPAISKTLKDLETILGLTLMTRDRGGITLTREGAVFRQFAEQSLAALSHGLASLDALSSGASTPIRVGALPSVAADLLPDAVNIFSNLVPSTPIAIQDGGIADMIDRLRSGDLDLVVGRMGHPENMAGLSFTQLYTEQVIIAAAADHPLAHSATLKSLADYKVLYPPKSAAIRPLVDRYLIENGLGNFPNSLETVSGAFGRSMTLGAAQAVWFISKGVVARDIDAGRMIALPFDTSSMAGPIGIMARAEEDPTPTMRLFRQALLDAATSR
ncbi:pca operon transcription factor PcaQ [Sulfitobacter donghicola]|uniref:HTH lysR-type domain-containing protein n=1 Tax=Sulfitobacter donghicola DSW-25 = KCTC 12864 = JCM 14565 TaxID=1300350 RepID=A0A073IF14_9RHOB|nr:pca operon transcription factor PcaQ [Sulfitobacter donghicola]KEJ88145.1 hypothetical protein DSW25_17015 [Sulfitobacter donghicola DSW-25 = KCTC 12864 = JCM 14565]KIN70080.1 Pca operon transcriptional activator PcaQ [Sulfitobacter donghicola DSW-25 = KCTC 12864 = JCM 14565]